MISTSTEYTIRDQDRMRRARNYFQWQYRLCMGQLGARVLEVGCGLGNFTRHLLDRQLVVAIDVEVECVNRLRKAFPNQSNLVALPLDLSDEGFLSLQKYAVDSIACLNVLEHVEDHHLALSHMNAVLPVGGKVVLIVPAFEALYGPIDARLGHYRRYDKVSLASLAERTGFAPNVLRYMNSIGLVGWWINSHLAKRDEQSEAQITIFDSLLVPVLSRMERIINPPFGQSLFAVLTKTKNLEANGATKQQPEALGRHNR